MDADERTSLKGRPALPRIVGMGGASSLSRIGVHRNEETQWLPG